MDIENNDVDIKITVEDGLIKNIAKLHFEPGDVMVVTTTHPMSTEEIVRLQMYLKQITPPGVRGMIIDPSFNVAAVGAATPVGDLINNITE